MVPGKGPVPAEKAKEYVKDRVAELKKDIVQLEKVYKLLEEMKKKGDRELPPEKELIALAEMLDHEITEKMAKGGLSDKERGEYLIITEKIELLGVTHRITCGEAKTVPDALTYIAVAITELGKRATEFEKG